MILCNTQDLIARDEHIHEILKAEARTLPDIVLTEVSEPQDSPSAVISKLTPRSIYSVNYVT